MQYAHVQKLLRKKRRWLSGDLITGAASVDSGLELYQDFFLGTNLVCGRVRPFRDRGPAEVKT